MVGNSLLLDSANIYDYFSVASEQDSVTIVGKKLFDFVDRRSKILVITIGDSWTWGADLTQEKIKGVHLNRLKDDDYRIKNVYGNILADNIGADFLNLGASGSGNWHIDKKLKELLAVQHRLDYKHILVISIFTELGRDWNSHNDVTIDYRSWLLENVRSSKDYYGFLKFVNYNISQSISNTVSKFDARYQFLFSTNFVDPLGYDLLESCFLSKSWLEVICLHNNINYRPGKCYMVFPWVIEKFASIFDMAPNLDREQWLEWVNEIVQDANVRASVCRRDDVNFGPLLHPSAPNHLCWAKYILRAINHDKL